MRAKVEERAEALSRGIWSVVEDRSCIYGEMAHASEWSRRPGTYVMHIWVEYTPEFKNAFRKSVE